MNRFCFRIAETFLQYPLQLCLCAEIYGQLFALLGIRKDIFCFAVPVRFNLYRDLCKLRLHLLKIRRDCLNLLFVGCVEDTFYAFLGLHEADRDILCRTC